LAGVRRVGYICSHFKINAKNHDDGDGVSPKIGRLASGDNLSIAEIAGRAAD
jgi:hypothetical protein